jgi:hypothetical protein
MNNLSAKLVKPDKMKEIDVIREVSLKGEMMVSANVPLNKVNNEQFKTFLEKYTTQLIPDESTLRKHYACYEDVLRKIRCTVWVSTDETTDVCGRYVANVVIGTLFADRPSGPLLCRCTFR